MGNTDALMNYLNRSGADIQKISFSDQELAVMNRVADMYGLNEDQTNLLYAIRKAENGRPGREFGVLSPEAMRFENNPQQSFYTQAQWAAGTIKKHYAGTKDLDAFSKRWAPLKAANDPTGLNKNWLSNVKFHLSMLGGL